MCACFFFSYSQLNRFIPLFFPPSRSSFFPITSFSRFFTKCQPPCKCRVQTKPQKSLILNFSSDARILSAIYYISDSASAVTLLATGTLLLPERFFSFSNNSNLLECSFFHVELGIRVPVASIVRKTPVILLTLFSFGKLYC